jgi:hypothetical protein
MAIENPFGLVAPIADREKAIAFMHLASAWWRSTLRGMWLSGLA